MSTTTTPEAQNAGHQLAASRHSAKSYAKSIVRRWPALTKQERAEVREILSPALAELDADGGAA